MSEDEEERVIRERLCSSPELMQMQLQQAVEEKEKIIFELEQKIEEQKKMRLNDAKQVEVKAGKIKEWVSAKLKELEEQNQNLREENRKCSEELRLLKCRMQHASPESRRKLENEMEKYYDQEAQLTRQFSLSK